MLLPGPDTRVVELRVHGIMGTMPETLVSAVAAVDVAGDGVGRIVRPADRLKRPAPGPVLEAEGRSIPRIVEGYVWRDMTSGGWSKAAWALLFPFALANVAHWMLPPMPRGHRLAARLGLANRSLLRLAAVLLTMLLVTQAAVVSLDLLAVQCLAPGSECLANSVPGWLRETYLVRPAIGLLPVLLVIVVLHRISSVAWQVTASPNPPPSPPNVAVDLPGTNLVADPDTPTLRALHVVAALATVALLPVGGPFQLTGRGVDAALWAVALALLTVAVLGVLVLDDPTGAQPERMGRWVRTALGRWPRRVLLGLGVALVLAVGAAQDPLPGTLVGTNTTVETLAGALIGIVVLVGVLLVPAALIARRGWRTAPRELRPWAGGWMSAPVLAMAALLGAGLGAGLAIAVRRLLGERLMLPVRYEPITLLWGAGAALGVLIAVPIAAVTAVRGWRSARSRRRFAQVGMLHATRPADIPTAMRAWQRAGWQRRHLHHLMLTGAGVLCAGTAISIFMRISGSRPPDWMMPLSTVGVLALGALVAGLLRTVYNAARAPDAGRHLGLIADLVCFWPREAHPIVPPCYALKVAPELAARTEEHLREPGTRVVLAGDSQGAVLIAVAAARLLNSLNEPERRRIGLITVGCPLQWAYLRAFPGVVSHQSLAALAGELGTRWRALCRGTDPLGGAVTTWRRQVCDGRLLGVGFRPDGTTGPLPAARRSPSGALVLGLDHWLPDPPLGPFPGRRWTPGVQRHRNYTADPEWDRAVALAAGLDPAPLPTAGLPTVLPTPRNSTTTEV
ncbi:MAG TPA: hypothetical protein VGX25_01270 [Actinophytocola sp.]|uniref:hypothetical protein n=1 Tax=Actinophytocola sp. TaxID=1872138 RepID=UPI002DDD7168|nr:hypothetical protein [Actinophytocola sp.]HEV2778006.1 hypothetical protein [Actinophytocola sp.]